ncbi:MAG: DUF763 domain-containing protein [Thermoprotei archaeon]
MEIEGVADLPLHYGRVPRWLIPIMRRLASAILDIMVLELGPERTLERFANPLWFQAFNNVIGMDWDSSGSTTVTTGILKSVLKPREHGLAVLGGKGLSSRKVPEELNSLSGVLDIDPGRLVRVSRLAAKVDTTLLQDGHTLYHHSLFVTRGGKWAVIQQGMNVSTGFARRYHWLDREDLNMTVEPHKAIAGVKGEAVNALAAECEGLRRVVVDLLSEDPSKILEQYNVLVHRGGLDTWISGATIAGISKADRLAYYRPIDVDKVTSVLKRVRESHPRNIEEALLAGLGPSSALALYLISDLIYSEPPSFKDPVTTPYDPFRYAYAIGGKDGIPYPVDPRVAKQVLRALGEYIEKAKLESKEKNLALARLMRLGAKE